MRIALILILILINWTSVKPLLAEVEYLKAKQTKKLSHLEQAVKLDPLQSMYVLKLAHLYQRREPHKALAYLQRAIVTATGDSVRWMPFFQRGNLEMRLGNVYGARESFKKSLYYWPLFVPAQKALANVNEVIKEHSQILIRFK